jgi:flagellin
MQINHNVRAMVTQHSLYTNNNAMSKSLEKLSTGLRINRAQDDAAGLAMSEQMRTQIRGLGKSKQNAQDGQAALQIAEGGLQEITNLMQRQRELAIQAANDTLTSTERKYLNDEFIQLSQEVGRIAKSTDYNGKNLLVFDKDANKSFGAASSLATPKAGSYTLHVGPNYSGMLGEEGKYAYQVSVTYSGLFVDINKGKWNLSVGGHDFLKNGVATISIGGKAENIYIAIDALSDAIKSISGARAAIGTYINRLEYTINNIANLEFNTQDAESRIRDTDFAKETTNFTRNQIMVQSATSMLAQANSLPQAVLGLLG